MRAPKKTKTLIFSSVVLVAVIALSACTVFALEGKISFGPNIEQFYNKIFSDDPDENANIAQQKIEEEVAKYEAENSKNSETSEKLTESETSKNEVVVPPAENSPYIHPKVFTNIDTSGEAPLSLPQGEIIQNGQTIVWKEKNGAEKLLVNAEEGHENNQVSVISISPDTKYIYYIKSVLPVSNIGNATYLGGFIHLETLTVHPLNTPVQFSGDGCDSDCVWSASGEIALIATHDTLRSYTLISPSTLQKIATDLPIPRTTISPDGTKLAYWEMLDETSSTRNLFIYDIATGEEKLLTSVTFDEGPSLPPMGPFWQGNDTILFNTGEVSTETGKYTNRNKIKSVDVSTGNVSALFPDGEEKRIFDYEDPFVYGSSSDGRYVLFASGGLKILDTQEGTLTATDVFDRYSSGLDDIDFRWDAETSSFKAYGVYDYEGAKEVDISLSLDGKTAVADKKLTITDPTFEVASIS